MKSILIGLFSILLAQAWSARACESELAELLRETKPHGLRNGFAYPVGYTISTFPDEPGEVRGRAALVLTHASPAWDKERTTADAVREAARFAREHRLTTIGLVSRLDRSGAQFFRPDEVEHVVASDGGAHRLIMPEAETVYFGGGRLSECLGETIRESLRNQSIRRIVLIADATFDFDRQNLRAHRLVDASDQQTTARLRKLLTGGQSVFGSQLTPGYRLLDASQFTFEIYGRTGRREVSVGRGPRELEVHVVPTALLDETKPWLPD